MEENKNNNFVDNGENPKPKKMRIRFEDGSVVEDGSYRDIYDKLGTEKRVLLAILSKKVNVEYYE